jgi:ABC-type dipeptide/oligopeptide/nickel transport system permease component
VISHEAVGGVGRLVGRLILSLLGAAVIVWALLPLAPGRPARRILLAQGVEDPTEIEMLRLEAALGLDRSLPEQFAAWLGRVVRGDLSVSWSTGEPVRDLLVERLPATALLALTALVLALVMAVPSALVSAAFHRRWPDAVCRVGSLIGTAVPSFVLALLALHVVVVGGGRGRVLASGAVSEVWLPALVLAIGIAATWARLLRATLLEALGATYSAVITARGASRTRLLLRHALPNALVPFLHAVGVTVGALLGGATIVESIFSWPGLGRMMVDSVGRRDLPVAQGFAVLATLVYVVTSTVTDAVSRCIDPRLGGRP